MSIDGEKPKNSRYTLWPKRFSKYHTERGELAITKYVNLAKKYNIEPSTFANAFVINRPYVTSNIISATSLKNLEENINSIDITLTEEMLEEIDTLLSDFLQYQQYHLYLHNLPYKWDRKHHLHYINNLQEGDCHRHIHLNNHYISKNHHL